VIEQEDLKRSRRAGKSASIDSSASSRVPPSSPEAEQGVLGCILWNPVECLPECEAVLRDGGDCFYDLRHAAIYEAMRNMMNELVSIDLITLQQRLKDDMMLDQVGGLAYLSSLQDTVPSAANLSHYLEIVQDKHTLRKLISTCTNIVSGSYESEGEVDRIVDEAERDILQVRPQQANERTWKSMLLGATGQIEERHSKGDVAGGISTGLPDLDRKTDGLHAGELIVVAAFPGGGKSALVGGIADHAAVDLGLPVGIFSLEMTGEEYAKRMISSRARVNLRSQLTEGDFGRMATANGKLVKAPIHIIDESDMTIGQLRARARKLNQKHNIKLWVVDYLQLLHCPSKDGNREQEVARISDGLKNMAQEFKVPVIALSQLNDDGKLRESRRIGQDAAAIWRLAPASEEQNSVAQAVNVIIEKQRNGESGVAVPLVFIKTFTRFECPSRISDEDVPVRKQHKN
jgi:replicative DNA helicase